MKILEKRHIPVEELELRTEDDDEKKRISGYGIVYNRKTQIGDDFIEVIRPGAARKALQNDPDIKSRFNHQRGALLGRTKSGTMEVEENQSGVKYTVYPPDTQIARDVMQSIERGDIDGSSFTFAVAEGGEEVTRQSDGTILREIFEFEKIGEIGPVEDQAYADTTTGIRSAEETREAYIASLQAQEQEANNINGEQALSIRKKKLELKEKEC